jgi:hypothetical protein
MSHKSDAPQSWSFLVASYYFRNQRLIFWGSMATGFFLAFIVTMTCNACNALGWRSTFITLPILVSLGLAFGAIGLVKAWHQIARKSFSPIGGERIKEWDKFTLIERVQVRLLLFSATFLSTAMGWVIGGLASLTWRS